MYINNSAEKFIQPAQTTFFFLFFFQMEIG